MSCCHLVAMCIAIVMPDGKTYYANQPTLAEWVDVVGPFLDRHPGTKILDVPCPSWDEPTLEQKWMDAGASR